MSDLSLLRAALAASTLTAATPFTLTLEIEVGAAVAFDIDVSLDSHAADGVQVSHAQLAAAGRDVSWLPRGRSIDPHRGCERLPQITRASSPSAAACYARTVC